MASTVSVKVRMEPDFEETMLGMPQVKTAVTKEASAICDRANALGAGFRTGIYYPEHKTPAVGGTAPEYGYEKAKKSSRYGCVASVHAKNYAAMKDQYVNNTLLKAKD